MNTGASDGSQREAALRLRSPVQVLWNVAWGLLFVGLVVAAMVDAGRVEAGGVPFAVGGALLAARAQVLRVVVTRQELVVHSWWRTRRFAREDVVDLRPVPYDGWWVRGAESPTWAQLRLTTQDGREHDLRAVVTVAATGKALTFCDTVMGRSRGRARRAASRTPR